MSLAALPGEAHARASSSNSALEARTGETPLIACDASPVGIGAIAKEKVHHFGLSGATRRPPDPEKLREGDVCRQPSRDDERPNRDSRSATRPKDSSTSHRVWRQVVTESCVRILRIPMVSSSTRLPFFAGSIPTRKSPEQVTTACMAASWGPIVSLGNYLGNEISARPHQTRFPLNSIFDRGCAKRA